MPVTGSRAAMSSRGYGQLLRPVSGTLGIFALGNSGGSTSKYVFSSAAVTAGTSLTASTTTPVMCAAGTVNYGIFALSGATVSATNLYVYSTAVVATATNLASLSTNASATGNSTVGIFTTGNATATTKKYNYSAATSAAASSLTANSGSGEATGSSAFGIFALGSNVTTTKERLWLKVYQATNADEAFGKCYNEVYQTEFKGFDLVFKCTVPVPEVNITRSIDFKGMRSLKNVTLRQVEKATGISNCYLSQLENGKIKRPSHEIVTKLQTYYNR